MKLKYLLSIAAPVILAFCTYSKLYGSMLPQTIAQKTKTIQPQSQLWQILPKTIKQNIVDKKTLKNSDSHDIISIDNNQLHALTKNKVITLTKNKVITIKLPDNNSYQVHIDTITKEAQEPNTTHWSGKLIDHPMHFLVITHSGDEHYLTISTPNGIFTMEAYNNQGVIYQPNVTKRTHHDKTIIALLLCFLLMRVTGYYQYLLYRGCHCFLGFFCLLYFV